MRIRYEMYSCGYGTGCKVLCDLTPKKANRMFERLKENAVCGWCELVAEEEHEGEYMQLLKSFERIRTAKVISLYVGQIGG